MVVCFWGVTVAAWGQLTCTRTPLLCERLKTTYNAVSTSQKVGIQKLASATPALTDNQLTMILDDLNLAAKADRLQFLDDLALDGTTQIGGNVPVLTLGKVQAWRIIQAAALTDATYRKEHALLTNVALLRNHPTAQSGLVTFLGGDTGLQTLLQQNSYAPLCRTYTNLHICDLLPASQCLQRRISKRFGHSTGFTAV